MDVDSTSSSFLCLVVSFNWNSQPETTHGDIWLDGDNKFVRTGQAIEVGQKVRLKGRGNIIKYCLFEISRI